jgi:hypothetical protein
MTYLNFLVGPAIIALIVLAVVLPAKKPRPTTEAEKRAVVLLRSWLTPEQDKQWAAHNEFRRDRL